MIVASALASPVVCDPAEARRILVDARIDEQRAPVTHPWLVPGLARDAAPDEVRVAVSAACDRSVDRLVEGAERWEGAGWSAYTVVLSSAEREGCSLVQRRIPISVGIGPDGTTYGVRGSLPDERIPDLGCPEAPRWRREEVLAGDGELVQLVLLVDQEGDEVLRTALAARRATPRGWTEQVLLEPAPARILDPSADGPLPALASARDGSPLVILSRSRSGAPCRSDGGQTVWQLVGERWQAVEGRDALAVLAREGLWRLAGDDAWVLVFGQDDERDAELLEPRARRVQRRVDEHLDLWATTDLPLLPPGFVLIAPAPWPTEDEARDARRRWGVLGSVARPAWDAVDACAGEPSAVSRQPSAVPRPP